MGTPSAGTTRPMRSIADQNETELGGRLSVLVRQKRDHEKLDLLLDELVATSGEQQGTVLGRIARLVFPHAFAEESVLWPELRRRLPDGEQLTLTVEREHQEINELWGWLEDGVAGAERGRVLNRLVALLREDVRDEEDSLLPRLQQAVSVRRLRALGVAWEAVRRTAPTRPHPLVARRPPGNALSALPLTVLDRTRDALDVVSRHTSGGSTTGLARASRALGGATARVDRFSLFRRGEHPSTHR